MMSRIWRARREDEGIAMVMIIGVTAVLATLVVAGIALAVGSSRSARQTQDWNGALAAAYAGVEEYESRLANDTGYLIFGNPASTFSTPNPSTPSDPANSNVTLPTGAAANPAFGVGTSGTWAEVPGSSGGATFRYEVDNSKYWVDGTLRVRSTGRVGNETRTIVADLKQLGFIDFLYFTDYEVLDPTAVNPTSTTNCAIHYPASRPGCTTINFTTNDSFDGPVHTNDAMHTNGAAQFLGKVTTAYDAPGTARNYVQTSGSAPFFAVSGDPQATGTIGMPATNSQLKKETRSDLPNDVPSPGCLYTGPTSITFHDDGTMTVISPWTRFTNTAGDTSTSGSNPSRCGTPGAGGLARISGGVYTGQRFAVPANTVIYVQNVPTTASNVNYTSTSPSSRRAPFGSIDCPSNGNNLGYPMTSETPPFSAAYGCRNGDAFVEGTLEGKLTVAAENYIYITDDLTYDTSEDILGLVGNNAVWVWNPMRLSGSSTYTPLLGAGDRSIDAAILSVAHTFMVQNYNRAGYLGRLHVHGAIAQRFRGPVATGSGGSTPSTGYLKDYTYDERFRYTAPPKFLSPVTTTYGVNIWVEVSPVFDAAGAYR